MYHPSCFPRFSTIRGAIVVTLPDEETLNYAYTINDYHTYKLFEHLFGYHNDINNPNDDVHYADYGVEAGGTYLMYVDVHVNGRYNRGGGNYYLTITDVIPLSGFMPWSAD